MSDSKHMQKLIFACHCETNSLSFEALTAVMFHVEVFWVVTLCIVVIGYQRFGGPCCLHLQGVVSYRNITRRQKSEDLDLKNHRCSRNYNLGLT
jgi:hypothetical protein